MPKERKRWRRSQPPGWYLIEGGMIHYVQDGWVKTECGLWIVPRMVQHEVAERKLPGHCPACLTARNETNDWP